MPKPAKSKPPVVSTVEALRLLHLGLDERRAATEFDWQRAMSATQRQRSTPPAGSVSIREVQKQLGLTYQQARSFAAQEISNGTMESELFVILGTPGLHRYYWWKKDEPK